MGFEANMTPRKKSRHATSVLVVGGGFAGCAAHGRPPTERSAHTQLSSGGGALPLGSS